jgi:hypothetical protein
VGKLAAQSDHRPARHLFALAPSRLLRNLGIRLMRPLAQRTSELMKLDGRFSAARVPETGRSD